MSLEQRLASLERTVRFQKAAIASIVAVVGVAMLSGAGGEDDRKELHVRKITTEMVSIVDDEGINHAIFGMAGGEVQLLMSFDRDNAVALKSSKDRNSVNVTHSGNRAVMQAKVGEPASMQIAVDKDVKWRAP